MQLSFDDISRIKNYCFYNVTELYRRYESVLEMSLCTFKRALAHDNVAIESCDKILEVFKFINSSNPVVLHLCDLINNAETIDDFLEIKKFYRENRTYIIR
jgi:hypothetical protein